MKITVLIKDGNAARLTDGIRLILGLTINHRVSLLITDKGADAVSIALQDTAFKNQFLESMELISKMSGIIRTEKPIKDVDAINSISKDDLTKFLLNADSIIVF
jgi:hypothetical protein